MRPPVFERLLSAVQPQGIDLIQVAVEAHNGLPLSATLRRELYARCAGLDLDDPEDRKELIGVKPGHSVQGKQTRSMRRRRDLRPGLTGLKGEPYLAACHSFLLDEGVRRDLHWALVEMAGRLARGDAGRRWPVFVKRLDGRNEPWVERLCELVLTWDWFRDLFVRVPSLYAASLGVSEEIWNTTLKSPFTALRHGYEDDWLARASAFVTRGISEQMRRYAVLDELLEAS